MSESQAEEDGQELDWRGVTGQLHGVHILLLGKSEVNAAKVSRKHRMLGRWFS